MIEEQLKDLRKKLKFKENIKPELKEIQNKILNECKDFFCLLTEQLKIQKTKVVGVDININGKVFMRKRLGSKPINIDINKNIEIPQNIEIENISLRFLNVNIKINKLKTNNSISFLFSKISIEDLIEIDDFLTINCSNISLDKINCRKIEFYNINCVDLNKLSNYTLEYLSLKNVEEIIFPQKIKITKSFDISCSNSSQYGNIICGNHINIQKSNFSDLSKIDIELNDYNYQININIIDSKIEEITEEFINKIKKYRYINIDFYIEKVFIKNINKFAYNNKINFKSYRYKFNIENDLVAGNNNEQIKQIINNDRNNIFIKNLLNFYSDEFKHNLLLERFDLLKDINNQIKQYQEKEKMPNIFNLINYCRTFKSMEFLNDHGYVFTRNERDHIIEFKIKLLYENIMMKQIAKKEINAESDIVKKDKKINLNHYMKKL